MFQPTTDSAITVVKIYTMIVRTVSTSGQELFWDSDGHYTSTSALMELVVH